MNVSQLLILLFSTYAVIEGRYLIRNRKNGKEFWGRDYTVMEGKDLIMPCHSRPKYGKKNIRVFLWQVLSRRIGKKWYNTTTLVQQYQMRKPFIQRPIGYRYNVRATLFPNTRKLVIKNITRYAKATYRCVIISNIKKSDTYIEMTYYGVHVKAAPKIESSQKSEIDLMEGNTLVLDCTSSGNPIPKVTWTRDGGQAVVNERTLKYPGGLLTINNVQQIDQGRYTCFASSLLGNDSRTFVVQIKVPARVITEEISYATIGEDSKIKCEAVGNPRPTFVWKWENGSGKISLNEISKLERFSVETVHNFEDSLSFLKIKNVQHEDIRNYTCLAKNVLGWSHFRMRLMECRVPETPRIMRTYNIGGKLDILWRYGSDGGKKIKSVNLEYSPENRNKWKLITIKNPVIPRYETENLQPQSKYKLRISATNEIGNSALSGVYYVRTGRFKRPRTPKIKAILPHKNHVDIIWSYEEDYQGRSHSFIIQYAQVNSITWKKIILKNPSSLIYSIANLCPQTDYKFRMFIKNESGKSAPTNVKYIKTDPKQDTLEVPKVSLGISWNHKNKEKKIKSIIIEYATLNSSDWSNVTIQNPQFDCHTIWNLHPETEYMVQIIAKDQIKDTLRSTVNYIRTGVPKRPNGQIQVRWKRRYSFVKIHYALLHGNQWEDVVLNNTTHYIIKNLTLQEWFKIQISMRNSSSKNVTKQTFYYRSERAPADKRCDKETGNNIIHQVNLTLHHEVHHSLPTQQTQSSRQQKNEYCFLGSLNMTIILTGTVFIVVIVVLVWLRTRKGKSICNENEQVIGNATFSATSEDKETVL